MKPVFIQLSIGNDKVYFNVNHIIQIVDIGEHGTLVTTTKINYPNNDSFQVQVDEKYLEVKELIDKAIN
jgi:hypothetical protein